MTPWREFGRLSPAVFVKPAGRTTVIDCWRVLAAAELRAVADVVHIGRGSEVMAASLA
jgi:hypothetical protein